MKTKFTTLLCLLLFPLFINAQEFYQYFDGDTTMYNTLYTELDTSSSNIWQIGEPQKIIFDEAFSPPNVLLTDTINFIPNNNTSTFQYTVKPMYWGGVLAIQWNQKIDMDFEKDGGLIEFSNDGGVTWQNVFNNPYVYNFYGFDLDNASTLPDGQQVLTGLDNEWKNIWLCYDISWLDYNDSLLVKHSIICDSIDNNNEGWMIDNLIVSVTIIHTVSETEQQEYLNVSPNPTTNRINIQAQKTSDYHIIEKMELFNSNGILLDSWDFIPTKFFIDVGHYPNGIYYLNIQTNKKRELKKVVIQK